jgi:hypothetical protein
MRPFAVKFTWSILYTKLAFMIILLRVCHVKLKTNLTITNGSDVRPHPLPPTPL